MNAYKNLKTAVENGICTITINRPDKMNALNRETVLEIGEAVKEAMNRLVFCLLLLLVRALKHLLRELILKNLLG